MKKWIIAAVLVVSVVCFTGIAFAGVTTITQGTFVFPYKITKPGSYQLQSNLTVPYAKTTAILVQADNVTIDLNGFAILGPTVCKGSGSTLECGPTGPGNGIDAGSHQNIKVYNGTVSGMGCDGIVAGAYIIIESVRAIGNGCTGIFVTTGTVSGNAANANGGLGIYVGDGIVSGNTAVDNGYGGFAVSEGIVSGNEASGNYYDGFTVGSALVNGNTAIDNGGYGLSLSSSTGYVNNVLVSQENKYFIGGVSLGANLCGLGLCP